MFLKNIVIISVFVIISEAAVIDPPQGGDITFSTIVRKEIPKEPNTKENWEKNRHIELKRHQETNTPDSHGTEDTNIDVKQGMKSDSLTEHNDNKLGHEKLSHSKGSNHIHSVGSRVVHSQGPTRAHDSRTDIERNTETNAKDEESEQSLGNGKLHTIETDAKKTFNEHLTQDMNTVVHPDKDHVKASRIHYDDNDTSNTIHHNDETRRTLKHGHGSLDITDSNNVINKSDFNTHNTQADIISDTPDERKTLKLRSDAENSRDKTTTTETTNIIRETPISVLNIVDENNEESVDETEKHQKESERSISDQKGTKTFIKENKYKEVTDNTLEHTNTLTLKKTPKLRTATPITITFKAAALDKHHLKTNERHEKEVLTQTPTTETIQGYKEESTSNYNFDVLPDNEENPNEGKSNALETESNDKNEDDSTDGKDRENNCDDDDDEQEDDHAGHDNDNDNNERELPENTKNDESQNNGADNNKDNDFGTMVFLMPKTSNDNSEPKDFIDSAVQSNIIQNLLHSIKSNNLSSKIMIAGPINDSSPENLYNQIKDHVKSYQSSLGIAEISISADIIQIYKGETITESNKNNPDMDKPKVEVDADSETVQSPRDSDTSENSADSSKTPTEDDKANSLDN